jgi:nitrate/TMAO reductase-like tetraheme cytochrome c subunit
VFNGPERFEVNSQPPAPRGFGAWLWRRPQRWFLFGIPAGGVIALCVGLGLAGGFAGVLKVTETTAFCTSCHEMSLPFEEFKQSAHFANEFGIRPTCASCHVPPTFFAGVMRHAAAITEVWGHLRGELDTPAKYEARRLALAQKIWKEFKANDSAECRSCHTASAMALTKQPSMAADAHGSMAKSGMTCIDCHTGVAHTLPQGS